MAAVEVRRATRRQIPEMADLLSRAFVDDPYFAFLAADAPERRQRMRGLAGHPAPRFGGVDRDVHDRRCRRRGRLAAAGHGGPSLIDSLRMMPAMGRLAGWRRLRTVASAMEALERRHRHHAPADHFYLSALGVDPNRQGRGIGTALMQPVLDECDRGGIPAYLETATARNVILYERLGFEVVEELTLPASDVHGWLMLRTARS